MALTLGPPGTHTLIWIINRVQEHHSKRIGTPNTKAATGQYPDAVLWPMSSPSNDFHAAKRKGTCRVLILASLGPTESQTLHR